MDERDLDKLTERIIGCAYQVSNTLGIGFVEKVYENAHVFVDFTPLQIGKQHNLERFICFYLCLSPFIPGE